MKKASPYYDERDTTLPSRNETFTGFSINRDLSTPNPYTRSDDETPYYGGLGIYDSAKEEPHTDKVSEWINERDDSQPEPHIPPALAEEKNAEFINEDHYRKRMKIRELDNRVFDGSVHQPLKDRSDYKISSKLRKIAKDGIFSYCCASVEIPNLIKKINEWQKYNINSSIVDEEEGLEKQPHCTILYGLENTYIEELNSIASKFGKPIRLKLGLMENFDDDNKHDVLIIKIYSDDLRILNEELKKLPYRNEFDEYRQHITIGYFKKGTIDKFIGNDEFNEKEFISDHFYISDKDGSKTKISIPIKISTILKNIRN